MVHCDIKPDNIMLKFNETGVFKVFLIDFGLSEMVKDKDIVKSNVKGTDKYIDPLLVVKQELTHYIDIWALGVLILCRLCP
jgi:serine/threonine protein kinase